MACQRSQSCCKPNQKFADIPNTRDNRKAVSGVTERRPLMISLRRGYETPRRRASSACVSSRGLTNSSKSISPGWVGGRFRGSRRATGQIDCGQHFLAARDAEPSKMSSVPVVLKDCIMDHIITGPIIDVKHFNVSPNGSITSLLKNEAN